MEELMISIIIPVYNRIFFLDRTLDSIKKNYSHETEIIIVDDGSDFETKDYLAGIDIENYDIKIISIENHGVSKARNIGIDNATKEYVFFLDSDDKVNTALSLLSEECNELNEDIICMSYDKYSETTETLETILQPSSPGNNILPKELLFSNLLKSNKSIVFDNLSSFLFKRLFLINNDIRFVNNRQPGEDSAFIYESLWKANTIKVIPEISIFSYRIHGESVTGSFTFKRFDGFYALLHSMNKINEDSSTEVVLKKNVIHGIGVKALNYYIWTYCNHYNVWKIIQTDTSFKNYKKELTNVYPTITDDFHNLYRQVGFRFQSLFQFQSLVLRYLFLMFPRLTIMIISVLTKRRTL
jgi:glycosyltransferase involved in cell wall biosynthesis